MLDAIVPDEVSLEIVDAGKVLDPVNFSVDPVRAGLSVVDPEGGTADEPGMDGVVEKKTDEVVGKVVSKSGVLKNNNKKSNYLPLLTQVLLLEGSAFPSGPSQTQ